jgi:hypothetical protein
MQVNFLYGIIHFGHAMRRGRYAVNAVKLSRSCRACRSMNGLTQAHRISPFALSLSKGERRNP